MFFHTLNLTTLLLLFIVFTSNPGTAQNVGINATGATPNTSAGLDVNFSNKGILVPQVNLTSTTDAATITTPATSLLVWNTNAGLTDGMGYYYNSGTPGSPLWVKLSTGTNVSSGTYTPTFINVSNYVSSVNSAGLWTRIGNIVNVSFSTQVTVSVAGIPSQFTISLPIATTISSVINDLQGTAVAELVDTYGTIEGRTPANTGFIQLPGQLFNSQTTFILKGNFQYIVQ